MTLNNREIQRQRELKFISNFLKQKEIDFDELQPLHDDPPDFILRKNDNYFGIEIVELWPKINSKPIIASYEKVIEIAESYFLKLTSQSLSLSFTFRGKLDTSKGLDIKLGKIIASWVRYVLLCEIDSHNLNCTFSNPIPEIPELKAIKYVVTDASMESNWHLSRELNFCIPISNKEVNELIFKKQNQILSWNKDYAYLKKWLLVVLTDDPSSTFLKHQQIQENWNKHGLFDEIFFFDNFMHEMII